MQTSATGRWSSSPPAPRASISGFTLIEILVVVVIIGVLTVGVVLSLSTVGGDRELDRERDRIVAATDYLHEQATLQNRDFGMRVFDGGYQFFAWEPLIYQWELVQDDPLLRERTLPEGLQMRLIVEGRPVVLPVQEAKNPAPQILLYSSGELNPFELWLSRPEIGPSGAMRDGPADVFAPNERNDAIAVESVAAGATR
ncbi:MAG: type II secretion system minor pseudopilin GspH [Nevskiaceae bacterium]|jgi:general secretion pathway protein H|nr:type II secretion system minor pseudopilin GspH [Nevskiaceae bacterium]